MSERLAWTSDEYGTSNLRLQDGTHVWIQARRSYCDRGHWEWGCTGLNNAEGPSYYFMRLDRARHQVQSWLSRQYPDIQPPACLASPAPEFQHPEGQRNGWRWEVSEHGWIAHAGPSQILVSLPDEKGDVIVQALGIDSLDTSDRFPRRYMDLSTAIAEMEDFLAWRLSKVHAEHPGPLDHAPIDLTPAARRPFRP